MDQTTNTPTPVMRGSYGAFGYIDQIVTFQCISLIQKIVDSGAFTFQNILLLLLILSFDAIKKCISKFMDDLDIIKYVNIILSSLRFLTRRRGPKYTNEDDVPKHIVPYITLNFKPTLAFWEGILHNNKQDITVSYTKSPNKNMHQTNLYEYELTETYTNIVVQSPRFEAYLTGAINIVSNNANNIVTLKNAAIHSANTEFRDNPSAQSFSDLLPIPEFAKGFRQLVMEKQHIHIVACKKRLESGTVSFMELLLSKSDYSFYVTYNDKGNTTPVYHSSNHKSPYSITFLFDLYIDMFPLLQAKYKDWDHALAFYELLYMISIISPTFAALVERKLEVFASKSKSFFGCDISRTHQLYKSKYMLIVDTYYAPINMSMAELPAYNDMKHFMNCAMFPETHSNVSCLPSQPSDHIKVIVYGDMNEWINHVQSITNSSKFCNNKSNESQIYILKLQEDETTEDVPNPEYETWESFVEKLKTSGQQDKINIPPPPSKTCVKTKTSTKIVSQHVNAVYKDMSNLYLRKEDMTRLMNCLIQFKEKKDLLKSLGIPNKLGVLLYGEPGTGKSSTIHAIASFLRKNIYYIQLNEVQTNEQLHLLFNHVTKNCNDGGIIVMEDIDAMTSVVHKREPFSGRDKDNDKLTLEFFLNILQGSLTADGTIFITTTNHLDRLDPAFYRDGRFDVRIEMRAANHHQLTQIYERFFSRLLPAELLQKIPEYKYTPAQFISRFRGFLLGNHSELDDKEVLEPFFTQM